jgi:hypothetical protein
MFTSKKILKILKGLGINDPDRYIDHVKFYTILRLLSSYQHIVLYHVVPQERIMTTYGPFIEYFKHDECVIDGILKWLEISQSFIDALRAKTGFNKADTIFFHIYELIELDIMHIMSLKKNDQLTIYGYNF